MHSDECNVFLMFFLVGEEFIVVVAAEEVDGRMVMTAKRGKASHSIFACQL